MRGAMCEGDMRGAMRQWDMRGAMRQWDMRGAMRQWEMRGAMRQWDMRGAMRQWDAWRGGGGAVALMLFNVVAQLCSNVRHQLNVPVPVSNSVCGRICSACAGSSLIKRWVPIWRIYFICTGTWYSIPVPIVYYAPHATVLFVIRQVYFVLLFCGAADYVPHLTRVFLRQTMRWSGW